ncbi:uncharacterized protein TRAVEDRAFT_72113 [Trametes versicolor FP-101664 SS1]|uniref:uncharacterized protein n=1 Tax=Trametes versicolor (strain FP-101664) TaxID=717944 RepID=UPI0004621539|nr:uncharacterized protein TRAVEDRAFT_72113 [Trametes versicolor FP-101664 SS1]EIW58596.1 hypothetical protein TRAVEDRAFT_72113 [Trametes versicolor FP-101664 SS1]
MRLPSYCESHGRRHHPYTQERRVRRIDLFMMAADAAEGAEADVFEDAEQGHGALGVAEARSDVAEHGSQEDLANLERVLFETKVEKPRGLATVVVELALYVTRALRRLCAS